MGSAVQQCYRQLLKAQRKTFQNDIQQLENARLFTRQQFLKNQHATPEQVPELIQIGHDAAHIIRTQIVQGIGNQPPSTTEKPIVYKLRIHQDTLLNDNQDIRTANKKFLEKKEEIRRRRKLGLSTEELEADVLLQRKQCGVK